MRLSLNDLENIELRNRTNDDVRALLNEIKDLKADQADAEIEADAETTNLQALQDAFSEIKGDDWVSATDVTHSLNESDEYKKLQTLLG
jgi:hypothetical protein